MTLTEKWNAIVSDFQANKNLKEDAVQNLWEEIFADADVFGYSKRSREIDIWRNIQIGSRERTVPDIIIRDSVNDKDLFVVELKQHNLPFNQAYKEQLFSYMRLLELKVGILICDKLYIYVRENYRTEYSIEISFTKNSKYGEKFIELFSKGDFNQERIRAFLIETEKTKSNISQIKKDIQQLDLKDLLVEYYSNKYTIEEIRTAIEHLHIGNKVTVTPPVEHKTQPQLIVNNDDKIGKAEAIRLFMDLGYTFPSKPTYASKNKTTNNYWANPNIAVLHNNWYLILNDWISKKLYLFYIPYNSIKQSQLVTRNDQPNKIQLVIKYSDSTFTDENSGVSFRPYLQRECQY